jgi:hypothetical protein
VILILTLNKIKWTEKTREEADDFEYSIKIIFVSLSNVCLLVNFLEQVLEVY